jgi:uncharacterized Rossmann fold enzyme
MGDRGLAQAARFEAAKIRPYEGQWVEGLDNKFSRPGDTNSHQATAGICRSKHADTFDQA